MSFTFGLTEWSFLPDDMLAQLRHLIDQQAEHGMPWAMLSGEPIDWERVLSSRPVGPALNWTMPYSSGYSKLEGAFALIYEGNFPALHAGRYIYYVPFRKSEVENDNNMIVSEYHGAKWYIITVRDMLDWVDVPKQESRYAQRFQQAERLFLADPHADPDTVDLDWFVGAVLAAVREVERQRIPFYVWWP